MEPAIRRTLSDLGLEYLDLYLIHFPISLRFVPFEERYPPEWLFDPEAESPHMEFEDVPIAATWAAMEGLWEAGLTRDLGVCNMTTGFLRDLLAGAPDPPGRPAGGDAPLPDPGAARALRGSRTTSR